MQYYSHVVPPHSNNTYPPHVTRSTYPPHVTRSTYPPHSNNTYPPHVTRSTYPPHSNNTYPPHVTRSTYPPYVTDPYRPTPTKAPSGPRHIPLSFGMSPQEEPGVAVYVPSCFEDPVLQVVRREGHSVFRPECTDF